MHTSVHAARWIEQAASLGYDCHVFPLSTHPPHHKLADVTLHIPTLGNKPRVATRQKGAHGTLLRAERFANLVFRDPVEAFRRFRKRAFPGSTFAIVDMSSSLPITSAPAC